MADENLSPLPTKLELIRAETGDRLVDQNGVDVTESQDLEWVKAIFAEMVRRYNAHAGLVLAASDAIARADKLGVDISNGAVTLNDARTYRAEDVGTTVRREIAAQLCPGGILNSGFSITPRGS